MTQVLWPSPVRFYAEKHWPGKSQFTKRLEQVSREICRLRENVHQNQNNNNNNSVLDGRLRKLASKQAPAADCDKKPVQNSVKPCHDEIQTLGHHRDDLKTKCVNSVAIQNGDLEQSLNHLGHNLRSARYETPSTMTISARRPIHEAAETTSEATTTSVVLRLQHRDVPRLRISESADKKTAQQNQSTVRRSERRQRHASSTLSADCEPSSARTVGLEKRPKTAEVRRATRSNVGRTHCHEPISRISVSEPEVDASDATTVSHDSNDAGNLHLHAANVHRSAADMVAVPSWRIIQVPKRYVMEGTENLTDEAYLKRHQRLESDEKRRKRWDLQRQRELSMYEHLRRDDPTDQNESMDDVSLSVPHSPDADAVAFVEVVDDIPTCAFGHPIPAVSIREFALPWKVGVDRQTDRRTVRQVDRQVKTQRRRRRRQVGVVTVRRSVKRLRH